MEDPPLFFPVVRQPVRHQALGRAEHDDPIPLPPLDLVDGREGDTASGVLAAQDAEEPVLEGRRVRVQIGHLEEAFQIVEMRSGRASRAVEQRHRRAEPDFIADGLQKLPRRRAFRREPAQSLEVGGEVLQFGGHLRIVDPGRRPPDVADRPAVLQPFGDPPRHPATGAAIDLDEIIAGQTTGGDRDAEVSESRAHAEPAEHLVAHPRIDRHVRFGQRHVRREEQRVRAGEHRDRRRCRTRFTKPAADGIDGGFRSRIDVVKVDHQRGRVRVRGGAGSDLLRHAHIVVGEQCAGGLGDRRRATIIDLQRMLARARKILPEVDQESRVRAGVPVDDLVVVADTEDIRLRTGGQPDEQHVRGREILELIDQEMAVKFLDAAPEVAVPHERLDRAVDLFVEVDRVTSPQFLAVGFEGAGQARNVVDLILDFFRMTKPEPDERKPVEVGGERIRIDPLLPNGHQTSDDIPDLALVEQSRPESERLLQDGVSPAVQRANPRMKAAQPGAHLLLCLPVVRHRQKARSLIAAVGQQVPVAFGEHAGLAGAGRGDDAGGSGGMPDRRPLVRREVSDQIDRRGLGKQISELDGLPMDEQRAIQDGGVSLAPARRGASWTRLSERRARAAVDPRGDTIRQEDVCGATHGRAQSGRLLGPPPDRLAAAASVITVRPYEEMEIVGRWSPAGAKAPERQIGGLGPAEPGRVDAHLDHDRSSRGPCVAQRGDHRVRLGQGGGVDHDPRGVVPAGRRGGAAGHDDGSSQHDGGTRRIGRHLWRRRRCPIEQSFHPDVEVVVVYLHDSPDYSEETPAGTP